LLTYDVLLDHIANFLIYLSGAPSFWFLLNTSYGYGCHLASWLPMSMQEYESLLAAANLAAYTESGFVMKPKECGIFLGGHCFRLSECNIEFDKNKFDIDALINGKPASRDKRQEFFVVWIGVMSMQLLDHFAKHLLFPHLTPTLMSAAQDNWHWDIGGMKVGAMPSCWGADGAMRAGGGRHNKS
jgi:hypothetical protein